MKIKEETLNSNVLTPEEEKLTSEIAGVDPSTQPVQTSPIDDYQLTEEDKQDVDDAVRGIEVNKKYGNQEVRTAAESLASTLSFGISDKFQIESGLATPEDILGRQEANPVASGLGVAAGIGATIASTGGAGGVAAAGAKTAPKAIPQFINLATAGTKTAHKAGLLVEKTLAKELAKYGTNSAAHEIVRRSIAAGAGSAVEGAFYGAGHLISENALKDVELSAENLLSYVGTSAVLGAAGTATLINLPHVIAPIGAKLQKGTKALGEKASPVTKKLGETVTKIKDTVKSKIDDFADADDTMLSLNKISPTRKVQWKTKHKDIYEGIGEWAIKNKVIKPMQSAEEFIGKLEQVNTRSTKALNSLMEEADKKAFIPSYQIYQDLTKMGSDAAKDLANVSGKFKKLVDNFSDKLYTKEPLSAKLYKAGKSPYRILPNYQQSERTIKLLEKRREIGDMIDWASNDAENVAMKKMYSYLNNVLEEAAEKSSKGGGKLYREINKDIRRSKELLKDARKAKESGGSDFSITSLKNIGLGLLLEGKIGVEGVVGLGLVKEVLKSDMAKRLKIIAGAESAEKKASDYIGQKISSFFQGAKDSSGKVIKPITKNIKAHRLQASKLALMNNNFAIPLDDPKRTPKTRMEAFNNIKNNFDGLRQDPGLLESIIAKKIMPLQPYAPKLTSAIIQTSLTGLEFLMSKMPKSTTTQDKGMFKKHKYQPSELELAKFERYVNAVDNPMTVVEDFASGKITREGAETLRAVYPKIFLSLQQQVLEYAAKGAELDYQKRIQIGILLDLETDESLRPSNIAALQQTFAALEQDQAEQQQATAARADKINKSSREETKQNRIAQR